MRRGFMLGKFQPPHLGHLFVCETAAAMVDEMTVLVCSTDAEIIPGHLRFQWMRQLLPQLRVLHMHRDIPQEPSEHSDFWSIWRMAIGEFHPEPIDFVFGSEQYLFQLAQTLDAEAVIVDPDREVFPAHGSEICRDPAANWPLIPPPVRPHFQKRVCLLGPESTGKSTLAKALAAQVDCQHMPEYGRTYDALYRQSENWTASDFVNLAKTHIAMRQALAPHAGPVLIEDTDIIQTAVWAEYLLGDTPSAFEEMISAADYADSYLLLSPEVGWTDDGTRYFERAGDRSWFFERCRSRLSSLNLPHVELAGTDWTERSETAFSHLESIVGSPG